MWVNCFVFIINQSNKEIIMGIDLQVCTELTTEEYCNLSEEIELSFEGQTRANKEGIYWIVWSNNEELFKVKCSLNYINN